MRLILFPVLLPIFWRQMTVSAAGRARSARRSAPPARLLRLLALHSRPLPPASSPPLPRCQQSGEYALWEAAAVMATQAALVVFNCWFLFASWRRSR